MPTPQEVLQDPDFQGLPFEEKIKVFDRIDSDFSGLPLAEKRKAMVKLTPAAAAAEPVVPEPTTGSRSYFTHLGNAISGATRAAEFSSVPVGPEGSKVPLQLDPLGSVLSYVFSPLTAAGSKSGEAVTEATGSRILGGLTDIGINLAGGYAIGKGAQLTRQGLQKIAPHLPGASVGIRAMGAKKIESAVASLAPEDSQPLYEAVARMNPDVVLPGFRRTGAEVARKEAALAAEGFGNSEIKAMADKVAAGSENLPFNLVKDMRQRLGEMVGELRGKQGYGAAKQLYKALSDDLESVANEGAGPAYELLKRANKAENTRFALQEMQGIFDSTIGKAREGANFNSSNFAQALNKVKKMAQDEPLFAKGIGQEGLQRIETMLDELRKIPVLPAPKGQAVGSALINKNIGIGGGVGTAVGAAIGGGVGAAIGGGLGSAAGAAVPWLISKMLMSDRGAQLLVRFMESPGGLMTPAKIAAMTAFVRGTTGQNVPPPSAPEQPSRQADNDPLGIR